MFQKIFLLATCGAALVCCQNTNPKAQTSEKPASETTLPMAEKENFTAPRG